MDDNYAVALTITAFILGVIGGATYHQPDPGCVVDLSIAKSEGFADGAYTMMDMMRSDLQQNPNDAIWIYNCNAHVLNAYLEDVGDDRRLPDIETESLYAAMYTNDTALGEIR